MIFILKKSAFSFLNSNYKSFSDKVDFSSKNTLKRSKSIRNRLNSTRAFEWCINCHAFQRNLIIFGKGNVKLTKIFFNRNMTIRNTIRKPLSSLGDF